MTGRRQQKSGNAAFEPRFCGLTVMQVYHGGTRGGMEYADTFVTYYE